MSTVTRASDPAGLAPAEPVSRPRDRWMPAVWSTLGAVVARAASLTATLACARLLPPAEFGQVGVIQSTVGMFAPLAGLGLAMTSTKFVAEHRDSDPGRAGRVLTLSLALAAISGGALAAVLVWAGPWLATHALASAALGDRLREAAGLLWLGVLEAVLIGALAGLGSFAALARAGAQSGVLSVPLVALLTWTAGVRGAIAGLVLALVLSCLWHFLALRRECRRYGIPLTLAGAHAERAVLFGFSLPSYLSGLLVAPVAWVGNALLVQATDGYLQAALFNAADRFRFVLIFIPMAVSRTAVPLLTRLRAAGDAGGFARELRWNLLLGAAATAGPAALCWLAAGPLMGLFGESFRPGWPVLSVLAFSAVPTVLNTQLGAALLSQGRAWERASADAVLAIVFVALAWWLVPRYGALGLAGVFAGAYSLASLMLAAMLFGRVRHA